VQRKSWYDHDVRVALHLKTGHIAGAHDQGNVLRRAEALDHETPMGRERGLQASVESLLDRFQLDPDRIDSIGVVDAQIPADGVLTARDDERIVDRKRDARRTGTLALAEAGGREQQGQRP
jgi:hypothetical protein